MIVFAPIGTPFRFLHTLTAPAHGAHPAILYAKEGDLGVIAGHGPRAGYLVKTPDYPAHFGVASREIAPMTPAPLHLLGHTMDVKLPSADIPKDPTLLMSHAEVVAARKAGDIPGWEPYRLERIGSDSLMITGGVPHLITRGPRKGKKSWVGCANRSEVVTRSEMTAEYARYERDTGGCGECMSTGRRPGSPSDINHPRYSACPRCNGSTKAPRVQGTPA